MENIVLTLHIIGCVVLITLVLLQTGKEGMGVIFGGGSDSFFGSSGAGGLLVKLTTAFAIFFLITSLTYTKVTDTRTPAMTEGSVMDEAVEETKKPAVTFEKEAEGSDTNAQ